MKNFLSIVLCFTLLMSLCSCGWMTQSSDAQSEESSSYEMILQVLYSYEDLFTANDFMLSSLEKYSMYDFEGAKADKSETIRIILGAKEKINSAIATPNFISLQMDNLLSIHQDLIEVLNKGKSMSEEEYVNIAAIEMQAAQYQVLLVESVEAFSFLYHIRYFDQLPDEQADKELEKYWETFGFGEDIECPETIEEKELYILWANKYSIDSFDSQEFQNELQFLRDNENLSSKEYNLAWAEFIQKYVFGTTEATSVASTFEKNI